MKYLLVIIAILAFLLGLIFAGKSNAVQSVEGFILFLLAGVCLSGAGIIEAVNRIHDDLFDLEETASRK